jgi:hypothetical protein
MPKNKCELPNNTKRSCALRLAVSTFACLDPPPLCRSGMRQISFVLHISGERHFSTPNVLCTCTVVFLACCRIIATWRQVAEGEQQLSNSNQQLFRVLFKQQQQQLALLQSP